MVGVARAEARGVPGASEGGVGSVTRDRGEGPRSPGAPPDTREAESLGGLIHRLFPGEGRVQMTATGRQAGATAAGAPHILSPEREGLATGQGLFADLVVFRPRVPQTEFCTGPVVLH